MFFMIYLCGYLLTTMPYTWIQLVRRKGKVGSKKAVQNFHVLPGLECAESILRPECNGRKLKQRKLIVVVVFLKKRMHSRINI